MKYYICELAIPHKIQITEPSQYKVGALSNNSNYKRQITSSARLLGHSFIATLNITPDHRHAAPSVYGRLRSAEILTNATKNSGAESKGTILGYQSSDLKSQDIQQEVAILSIRTYDSITEKVHCRRTLNEKHNSLIQKGLMHHENDRRYVVFTPKKQGCKVNDFISKDIDGTLHLNFNAISPLGCNVLTGDYAIDQVAMFDSRALAYRAIRKFEKIVTSESCEMSDLSSSDIDDASYNLSR